MEKLNHYWDMVVETTVLYAPKILLALVVLFIGLRVIAAVSKLIGKGMDKHGTDQTLKPFALSLIGWILKAMLFISVIQMMGIATTSFIAVLGAAGLAIGLALQGTLANFAGGALILLFKPYKVGDLIESMGKLGVVKEIQIFTTVLLSPQNKTIILPNGAVSNGEITNYTREGKLRVDLSVGISYDSDMKKAKDVLLEVLEKDVKVLKDPAPFVGVSELGDSSVNLAVRPWATPDDYWDVYFGITEKCKNALDEANISIPFPQMDVHMDK
ncbi:MAG: mechanosensitive ion channel family protein [Bacteroidetes bacterium]|nr:MAG: mechanosensitive ion channel family protein [Bacteroidota bacterium]